MRNNKRRGLSMGTRMLLFSSLLLIALPWLGFRYIDQMKDFLLQGQEDAQLLTARALASVLHGRTELFHAGDRPVDMAVEINALYVYPLEEPVEIDGYSGDWGELRQQAKRFGDESVTYVRSDGSKQSISFSLLLGEYGKYIYALLRVKDRHVVYRHPKYRRLDHSDHVRLEMLTAEARRKRFILITDGEGQVSVYEMNPDWITAVSGKPVYALSGIWRERSDGYHLELRIPAAWLGPQPQMMISVANVDSPDERKIDSILATLDEGDDTNVNLLITRSPELDRILQGLGSADATICVVDQYRRVRGVYGGDEAATLCSKKDTVSGELVDAALEGNPSVSRYMNTAEESVIVAVHPVNADEEVLGAVLVEKNSSHILGLQRQSLLQIIVATLVVFLVAILGLLLFSAWLAFRIRKLQKETSQAIDADGRVVAEQIQADKYATDEIGQLSRHISSLLHRLKSYTGFLESVPRTLRHEILNPVNTISMSLQKIDAGDVNEAVIKSARKAVQQLEVIVHGLTEAAHIEDALTNDDYGSFDIVAMIREYIANSKLKHGDSRFNYVGPDSSIYVLGNDLRIAQLLDKLKDNALDFSDKESEILFKLKQHNGTVELTVANEGPGIADEVLDSLFTGMISSRLIKGDKPHLGIGLFIANRIAQQHQGELKITNFGNNKGVKVSLVLPVTE
jgi:signal transduction histidine kinase